MDDNRNYSPVKISFWFICQQLATIITILTFAIKFPYNGIKGNEYMMWIIIIIVIIIVLSVVNRIIKSCLKKECKATAAVRGQSDVTIIIKKGSVLKQKGVKVIHVQDTFETRRDKCKKDSLLRAFLTEIYYPKRFDRRKAIKNESQFLEKERNEEPKPKKILDRAIESSLENVKPVSEDNTFTNAGMKGKKYEIGTVATYPYPNNLNDENAYKIVAFSNMHELDGHVEDKVIVKYKKDVEAAFKGLREDHRGNAKVPYNVGIWGFQYNGMAYPPLMRIEIMVKAFIAENRKHYFCDTLRICINGKDANNIDFKKMQIMLEYFVLKAEK